MPPNDPPTSQPDDVGAAAAGADESGQGVKLVLVIPGGVLPGEDISFTSPAGRDLNVS